MYISSFRIFNKVSIHVITMTATYIAISLLKQSIIPHMQIKIFLSYLPKELLLEYLSLANVYNGNKPTWNSFLIDLIVDDKYSIKNVYTEKDSKWTIDKVNKSLSRNRDHAISDN